MKGWRACVRLAALAAGTVSFVGYLLTLGPGLVAGDSGEYAAAVWTLGVPHPPGSPLYVLLGWVWSHAIPVGSVIFRLNVLSALCSSVAIALSVHLFLLLGTLARGGAAASDETFRNDGSACLPRLAGSVIAALALGFSGALWNSSLSASPLPLQTLLSVALLWLFFSSQFDEALDAETRRRRGAMFALLFGASFTNSLDAVVFVPVFALLFFLRQGMHRAAFTRVARGAPLFALGLTPFVFLALRAAASPAWNWGGVSDPRAFIDLVTGRALRAWMFADQRVPAEQLAQFIRTFPSEFSLVLAALALAGGFILFARHRRAGVGLFVLALSSLAFTANNAVYAVEQHFIPVTIVLAAWLAVALHILFAMRRRMIAALTAVFALAALGLQIGLAFPGATEHDNHIADDYARNVLQSVPQGGVLLTDEWPQCVAPSLYLQLVEGLRRDVTVVDARMLRREWYCAQLEHRDPSLLRGSESRAAALRAASDDYQRGGGTDVAGLDTLRNFLLGSIVARHAARRPICTTIGLAEKLGLGRFATPVPEGLALRLYAPDAVPSLAAPVWDAVTFRRATRMDDMHRSIEDRYFRAFAMRGNWLYRNGDKQKADEYFKRATDYEQFKPGARWKAWRTISELFTNTL